MFGAPHNVFDRSMRKHFWLTGKAHATGTLKNYAFPFCRAQTVLASEVPSLPFKYLLLSHGGGQPDKLTANVELTDALAAALSRITSLGAQSPTTFATDATAAPALLAALDDAKSAFAAAPRAPTGTASPTKSAFVAEPALLISATPSQKEAFAISRGSTPVPHEKVGSAPAALTTGGATPLPPHSMRSEEGGVRLALVRTAVTGAIVILSVADAVLAFGGAAARAAAETVAEARRRVFCFSLAPGGGRAAPKKEKVVIVGGSFSGLRAQRELSDGFDVTVVDTKEYFEYTPGVLRLYTKPSELRMLTAALPTARSSVVVGEVTEVAPNAVYLDDGRRLPYDYAIIACGAGYPCAPVRPTADEPDLTSRQAVWDGAAAALAAAPSAVVVGGGLVGVELAAEIVEAYPKKPLTLLTNGATLCSALPPRVGVACRRWLEAKGVKVVTHSPVESVDAAAGVVTLRNGGTLEAGVAYDCRGNGPSNAAALFSSAEMSGAVDEKGRLNVDESLCLKGGLAGGRVFGVGDAMSLPKCTDLKLGHTAELNADVAAENVSHLAKHGVASEHEKSNAGLATYPYGAVGAHTAPRVYCVSLGEAAGVLVFNGIVIEGMLAAITKPLLEWTKVAACAERPVGVAFWKFGDAVANWISRTLVPPPPPVDKSAARPLVLFDGVCLLCSTFVQFVLDHNADETITFAALQSAVGEAVLQKAGLPLDVSTVVYIDEAGVHTRSTAALRVLQRCGLPYAPLAHLLIWIPRPLRDAGYKMVAAVRYRVFGKDDGGACRRMTKAIKARFLDHVA